MGKTVLSIIIPYYNTEKYTEELLDCLAPQITEETEVILIDDGSRIPFETGYDFCRVIRQKNKGVSAARNRGITEAVGEYITFIDSDDLVPEYYVEKLLEKMRIGFDYLEMSWKTMPGGALQVTKKLIDENDKLYNPSVCTRAFRKGYIGDLRFNEKKFSTEDDEFTRKLYYQEGKKAVITDFMYFYRTSVENSKSKKFLRGELKTKRVIYNLPIITADMTYLIPELEKEDELNEVWILNERCDIPEVKKFARLLSPRQVMGHELRGYPTPLFKEIKSPIKTQVVIYTKRTITAGGIETFIYNFCSTMKECYDIIVVYDVIKSQQLLRLEKLVECRKNDESVPITCDTVILNKITDAVPTNIAFKQKVQMCHTTRYDKSFVVPGDCDYQVFVSEYAASTFETKKEDYKVIHNLTLKPQTDKTLILISATRLNDPEKGEQRMRALALKLKALKIPFIWFLFSNQRIDGVDGILNMGLSQNVAPFIKAADYLVQLSNDESFCLSIVEALEMGTAVLTTGIGVLEELGFKNEKHGYILPFDMNELDDSQIMKLYKHIPKNFKYSRAKENDEIKQKWIELLGSSKPTHSYIPPKEDRAIVRAKLDYHDIVLNRKVKKDEELIVTVDRAADLKKKNLAEIVE